MALTNEFVSARVAGGAPTNVIVGGIPPRLSCDIGRFEMLRTGIAIFFLLPCCGAGCARTGTPHRYVVPDAYRGVFRIKVDKDRGLPPSLIKGEYVFKIPGSGVLLVDSPRYFEPWHMVSAEYASGGVLPTWDQTSPDQVALRGLNSLDFLVGTDADRDKAFTIKELKPGPLSAESTYYSIQSPEEATRYFKDGRRHGIETTVSAGRTSKQEHWVGGRLVEIRESPPWFTDEEIALARK